jgi:tRNA (guanine10-N2)-methyltransferase
MVDDILNFAACTLVDGARLSMWMPSANENDVDIEVPTHSHLKLMSVCTQAFNKCMFCAAFLMKIEKNKNG